MAPDDDVGAALTPCPPDFPGMSVRAVRAKTWPLKTCFAIVGHLTATYAEGPVCLSRPLTESAQARATSSSARPSPEIPRCSRGWVLADLSDPAIVREETGTRQPFIGVSGTPTYMPWMDHLLACNHDSSGKAILPARARFRLPTVYDVNDIPRLNASLAGATVGVVGGQRAPDDMANVPDDFGSMFVTHVCRVGAPDGGTRGE